MVFFPAVKDWTGETFIYNGKFTERAFHYLW